MLKQTLKNACIVTFMKFRRNFSNQKSRQKYRKFWKYWYQPHPIKYHLLHIILVHLGETKKPKKTHPNPFLSRVLLILGMKVTEGRWRNLIERLYGRAIVSLFWGVGVGMYSSKSERAYQAWIFPYFSELQNFFQNFPCNIEPLT